ncbi:MAG: hypothetical protein WBZ35_07805 [Pseudolabrys sp.]
MALIIMVIPAILRMVKFSDVGTASINISRHRTWLEATMATMEIFRAEKIAVLEDQSNTTCRCGEKLAIVRVIVNSLSGDLVYMFKCQCGERTWKD